MTARRLPVLLLLAAAACTPGRDAPDTISRERFVAANLALRVVPDTAPGADSLRAAALAKAGVTPAQLRAWVRGHRGDSELLADAWKEIADSLQRRDSVAIAQRPPQVITPEPAPAGPPPPTSAPEAYALPERPVAPGTAPVRAEPPLTKPRPLEVRGQMPVEPDSTRR